MAELAPGDEFAGCRIEAVAGRGGMGVVYRATDLSLGRPVALKLLPSDRAADPAFRERFQRESRMAAAIEHPNVIPVYAAGEEEGSLYLVMRYVAGTDLHALLREDGALDPPRAAEIVGQVAAGLDAAHAAGLVHRDVKPANVLLAGGHAYLSDFGLTRLAGSESHLTESGQWIGTVEYCSPEQLRGDGTDARADVYSLGCVLFAALTGRPPFAGGTVPATMFSHLHEPPPRASERGAPADFDRVLARALAKDPEARYPSAGDLGRAALGAARGEPVTESERSVARGPAAPGGSAGPGAPGEATAVTTWNRAADTASEDVTAWDPAAHTRSEGVTAWDPAAHTSGEPAGRAAPAAADEPARRGDGPPPFPERPDFVRARRRPPTWLVAAAAFLGLVALGVGLGQVLGDPAGSAARARPLTENEVREAAQAFADAYSAEDPAALRRAVTRDVLRVLPGGPTRGRREVVAQYKRQFDGRVERYELDDLEVAGGRAGRAKGTYRVEREGGAPYAGTIVFGVVRDGARPRIRLIAANPTS